jgi:GR25 family glycosyltransferase involved in LPS biosynthesis
MMIFQERLWDLQKFNFINNGMKAYIITLKDHQLSETVSKDCQNQATKFGIDVEVFDAIWGDHYQKHMKETGLKLGRVKKGKMTVGHYGNFFSHYYLWLKCIDLQTPIIILEHDGYFIRPIPKDILNNFRDVLKLDFENPYTHDYSEKINRRVTEPVHILNSVKNMHKRKKTGWYTWGSYAYICKPSGAKKLVDYVRKHGLVSTDNQIADEVVELSICSTSIARLHPMYDNSNLRKLSTTTEMGMPENE